MTNCTKKIREKSNGYFNETEAQRILDDMESEAKERAFREGKSPEDFYKDIYLEKAKQQYIRGQIVKRSQLINESVRAINNERIANLEAEGLTRYQAVKSIVSGVYRRGKEAKYSADAQYKATVSKYLRELLLPIDKEGWVGFFADKNNEAAIYRELSRLNNPDIKASGFPQAVLIAKQIQKTLRAMVAEKNRAGANIGILADYEIIHSHDPSKIKNAGFAKWVDDIQGFLDVDRIMRSHGGSGKSLEKILAEIYSDLSSSTAHAATGSDLGEKMAAHRMLHFKNDGESWLKYNSLYGYGSLASAVAGSVERGSRDLALLRNFGTNPDAMFESMISGMSVPERYKMTNLYKNVNGSLNNPVYPTLAKISYGIQAFNSMRMLGKMVLGGFLTDAWSRSLDAQYRGTTFSKALIQSLGDVMNPFTFKEKQRVASLAGVGHSGMVAHFLSKTYSPDGAPGAMANLQRLFFKLNTQNLYDDAVRQGVAAVIMHDLAFDKGVSYERLNPKTQSILNQYGIDGVRWDTIRSFAVKLDGKEFIAPDTLDAADPSKFTTLARSLYGVLDPSQAQLERARDDVANRLRTYIVNSVDRASNAPGAQTRATLNQGLQRGTPMGEAVALLVQFKQYSVTSFNNTYGRVFDKGFKSPDIPQLIQSIVGFTIAGYITNAMYDLASGREPRPIDTPDAFIDAFIRGGAGGWAADMSMNQAGRQSKWAQRILGPTFGDAVGEFMDIKSAAFDGEDVSKRSVKYLERMIPGNNLYYKPVFDYLFMNQLREIASPGTAERMMEYSRERGQGYWLPPTKTLAKDIQ